jgi:hypothetical protein
MFGMRIGCFDCIENLRFMGFKNFYSGLVRKNYSFEDQ